MENKPEVAERAPKEIVYATQNEAKLAALKRILGEEFKIVSLKDLGIESQAEEDGIDPKENALKKARFCFRKTGQPSFSMDFGFFIEGLEQSEQPGPSVKRIVPTSEGKEVTDEGVLAHYKKIVTDLGGKANAYWLRAMAFVSNEGEFVEETKIPKILIGTPSQKRVKGFPMTSLQIDPTLNKYESEMTDEEKNNNMKTTDEAIRLFVRLHNS